MVDSDEYTEKKVKIVLLGEARVGKTSIITRIIKDTFDYNCLSSSGASFSQKLMLFDDLSTKVNFLIWDTVGQEKYRSISKLFYRDAAIAILVLDITDLSSFEEIKNYWLNEVRNNTGGKCILGLAANKSDLIDKAEVSEQEIKDFAQKEGLVFKFTSALNNTGINELFIALGNKYLGAEDDMGNVPRDSVPIEASKTVKSTGKNGDKKKSGCC